LDVDLFGDLSLVLSKEWRCTNEKSENCTAELRGYDIAIPDKSVKAPTSLLAKSEKLTVELSLNFASGLKKLERSTCRLEL